MKQEQFEYDTGERLWFTSDTHWGHSNILEFCKRPFSSVEEMNQKLIENWNSVVKPGDTVFHLGDFAWGGSQMWNSILDQLNGDIYLIKGNHDDKNIRQGYMNRFKWVGYQMKINVGNRAIYLNHFPFLCYGGSYRGVENVVYSLHGHTHLNTHDMNGKDIQRLNMCFPTQLDVGVDAHNYTPISFDQVDTLIKEQIEHNQNQIQSFKEYLNYAENKKEV